MSDEKGRPATGRPSENAAARKPLRGQNSAEPADARPLRPRWSQALIDGADGPVPAYRSPAWLALPDDSRAKVAATVLAAEEAWAGRTRPLFSEPGHGRRAREIAEARRPRPGDYQGGRVDWDRVAR